MRKGVELEFDEETGEPNVDFMMADWTEDPRKILETIDMGLKEFGLEIVTHTTDADFVAFNISPRMTKGN